MFSEIITVVPIIVSIISLAISIFTYIRASPSQQLELDQNARMRTVAMRTIVLWDQISTIVDAQVHRYSVDPYLFPSIQQNAKRLEDALDEAISVGLLRETISDHPDALQLYSAFTQGLSFVRNLPNPESQPLEQWTRQHFLMGLIRLLDRSFRYRQSFFPEPMKAKISNRIDPLLSDAWNYLGRPPRERKR
jgi:hypothetical protein